MPPTAIDLFKDLHCSKKKGFSASVKDAIVQMEAIVAEPPKEGEAPKTPSEAVVEVLQSSKFLQNIGFQAAAPKRSQKVAVDARVQELESQIELEKQTAAALKDKLTDQHNDLEALKSLVNESEDARLKQFEEIQYLKRHAEESKKQAEETNALLRRLLCVNRE